MEKNGKNQGAESLLARRIARASKGLNFVSENDAPVVPFFADQPGESVRSAVRKAAGDPPEELIEETDAKRFFDRLTCDREWYNASQKKNAAGFKRLQKLLEEELTDLRVFRVGNVKLKIYVVGLDPDGNLAGVLTEAIETS